MNLLRNRVRIERQVARLRYTLSVEALQLNEEYQKRIEVSCTDRLYHRHNLKFPALQVLKALDFVDSTGMVTFKGRVACEIHHQVGVKIQPFSPCQKYMCLCEGLLGTFDH